ncbi:MAG TPA: DUF4845 domain-containing protein [Burkholderiaceae bacterium]
MIGLLFWAIVVAFVALMIVRVLPTINEYSTILRAVQKIAKAAPATVAQAREAFEKQKEVEYSIASIGGKDLQVTKENDGVVIRFAYDKEVEIFEPVFLLIKYRGEGRSN